jgi:hypothetical protein
MEEPVAPPRVTVEYVRMDAQEPASGGGASPEPGDEPQGVFGNLPRTRPGARSPRRDAGAGKARHAEAAAPPAKEEPTDSDPVTGQRHRGPSDEPQTEGGGGLEDVAWAGVAAAAEAATIGVRLANRALEAMRDAMERR